MEHEAKGRDITDDLGGISDRLCLKLRAHLGDLMGTSGFHFTMDRAISAARVRTELIVGGDGSLEDPTGAPLTAEHLNGVTLTLACFLDILDLLVGPNLLMRLIHQAWPEFDVLPPFTSRNENAQ